MSAPRLHSSKNTTHFTFYFILVVLEEWVITPYFTAFYFTSSWMKERGGAHYPLFRWLLLYSGRDGGGGYYPYFTGFYFTLVVNEGRGSLPPSSLAITILRS